MTSELTVDGYTFDNPPSDYRKIIQLQNNPLQTFARQAVDFYQSDSQNVQVQVSGELSLNESTDLTELETLQQKAIQGGEVSIDFDPFFSGTGVITDNPFRQEDQRGQYDFTFSVNSVTTDPSGYPDHATPTTGNTFELGDFNFGFDPDSVQQQYERLTPSVETLSGLNQTVDNKGLIPRVTVSGRTDGSGGQALWQKARDNALSYLSAEFQNGWSLLTRLQVGNDDSTPDFVTGLLQYSMDVLIVKDPSSGIGQVSSFIDHDTRDTGSYTADEDSGSSDPGDVSFQVFSGVTDLNGQQTAFVATTVDVDLGLTNYVYVTDPDGDGTGQSRVNQSAFPADSAPLWRIETDNNGITNVVDARESDTSGGDETATTIGFTVGAGSDSGAGVSWSDTVLELDPSTSNYIYADGSTGGVSFNTSGVPSGDVALYEVQTDANSVDVVIDLRAGTTTGGDDTVDTLGYDVSGGSGAIDGDYVEFSDTTVDLSFGATSYVFVTDPNDDGQGTIEVNESAVPNDALGLWEVVTDGQGITSETDLRDSLIDPGDGSDSDLVFSDSPSITDAGLVFDQTLPIADIFDVQDGFVSSEPNRTWSTASDWDNNVSSQNVRHPSDTVLYDGPQDGFEDGQVDDTWTVTNSYLTAAQDRVYAGDYSAYTSNSSSGTYIARFQPSALSGGDQIEDFFFYYQETSNQSGGGMRLLNSNGDVELGVATDNPQFFADGASGPTEIDGGSGYDDWVKVTVTPDWSAGTFDVEFYNIDDDYTRTGTFDLKQGVDVETVQFDDYNAGAWQGGSNMDMWIDNVAVMPSGVDGDGVLTTTSRTYSSPQTPFLTGLSYDEAGGTVRFEVVGSPGTDDEEVVTVLPDGDTDKPLNWSQSHTDFQLRLRLRPGNAVTEPSVSAVELTLSDVSGRINWFGQATLSEAVPDVADADLSASALFTLPTQTFGVLDGGSSSDTAPPQETLTWETASDWDGAVSESGVVHESTANTDYSNAAQVRKGQPIATPPASPYLFLPLHENSGSTAYNFGTFSGNGNANVANQGVTGPVGTTAYDFVDDEVDLTGAGGDRVLSYSVWIRPDLLQNGATIAGQSDNSGSRNMRLMQGFNTNSIEYTVFDGSSNNSVNIPTSDLTAGQWYHVAVTDNNGSAEIYLNGVSKDTMNYGSAKAAPPDFLLGVDENRNQDYYDGGMAFFKKFQRILTPSEISADYQAIAGTSEITTATKSFVTTATPNLQNLQYSRNGQSIDLDVIGSPGGANEEVKTVTLTGNTSYTISWTNSHADFRVKARLTNSNVLQTPTVNRVELIGGGGGGDGDQNPQTSWELTPGIYERQGNEYEGGGVITKYGN